MTIPEQTMAKAVRPEYSIGQEVIYVDHHKRLQTGEVIRIEAHWGWGRNDQPSVIYTVEHPTYRNGRMYVGAEDIRGTR